MPASKKPRKKHTPKGAKVNTIDMAIAGAAKMTKVEVQTRLAVVEPSFEALTQGRATTADWKCVLNVYNVLQILGKRPGCLDPRLAKPYLAEVRETFDAIAYRRAVEGKQALYPTERELVWGLFTAFEDALATLTVRDIEAAEYETIRRIDRKENVRNLKEIVA